MKQRIFEHIVELNAPRQPDEAPIGRCIYCNTGRDEQKLTREHVIPDGLGGVLVIPEASCLACADKINRFEQRVMKSQFGVARMANRIQARDKKRKSSYTSRQNVMFTDRLVSDDEATKIANSVLPAASAGDILDHYQDMILVEEYCSPPGIMIGMGQEFAGTTRFRSISRPTAPDRQSTVMMWAKVGLLERLVAKIAHSFAVARLGIDAFKPYLQEFIISDQPTSIRYLIGSYECQPTQCLHRLALYPMNVLVVSPPAVMATPKHIVVCDIHLFSQLNTVCYQVVVGERS
jgi:hypothetical protein